MERNAIGTPAFYSVKHIRYSHYELRYLEAVHLLLVDDPHMDVMYYLFLTPAEDAILWRLLQAPANVTVPFQELLPTHHQDWPRRQAVQSLQHHVGRLKKKLPPGFQIVCEIGLGYRLRVIQAPSTSRNEALVASTKKLMGGTDLPPRRGTGLDLPSS